MTIYDGIYLYSIIGLTLFCINAFVIGYKGLEFTKSDYIFVLIWPVIIIQLFGMLTALLVRTIRENNDK